VANFPKSEPGTKRSDDRAVPALPEPRKSRLAASPVGSSTVSDFLVEIRLMRRLSELRRVLLRFAAAEAEPRPENFVFALVVDQRRLSLNLRRNLPRLVDVLTLLGSVSSRATPVSLARTLRDKCRRRPALSHVVSCAAAPATPAHWTNPLAHSILPVALSGPVVGPSGRTASTLNSELLIPLILGAESIPLFMKARRHICGHALPAAEQLESRRAVPFLELCREESAQGRAQRLRRVLGEPLECDHHRALAPRRSLYQGMKAGWLQHQQR
jgi:hypothetical protein